MPSPVSAKCRGSVVRQFSLQNQSPLQSSSGCRTLKKQLSEDDSRFLDPVEITGQGWMGGETKSDGTNRVGLTDGKVGQMKIGGFRPKPAKLAWSEKKLEFATEFPHSSVVEVVATKCPGQPRPFSVKSQRFRTPLLGNKDTLAYTRLELAERLRSAWSEREKTRPNLNIFLAHASDASRTDSRQTENQQDNASTLSDAIDKKRKSMQLRAFSQDYCPPDSVRNILKVSFFGSKLEGDEFIDGKEVSDSRREEVEEGKRGTSISDEEASSFRELNKIEIRFAGSSEPIKSVDPSGCDENSESPSRTPQEEIQTENFVQTAKERRANFRRGNIFHGKPIEDEETIPGEEEEKRGEKNDEIKKSNLKKPLVRALSAPSHDQTSQKQERHQRTVKFLQQNPMPSFSNRSAFDPPRPEDDSISGGERIKSAPVRRKLKTVAAAARKKNKEKAESSSEEEKETRERKKTTKRRSKNGSDIITMVSLVSPAESDTEESVINLAVDTVLATGGDKEDGGGGPSEAKCSTEQEVKGTPFVIQKFVSLRKTVTFQTHPVPTKNYSASFPSRRAPAGTPIIVPSPAIGHPALTPAQIQERDKRMPGADGRGIKRRLIRSHSEPIKGEDFEENQKSKEDSSTFAEGFEAEENVGKVEFGMDKLGNEEPQFKCPKEKECWALYKKMVAKGISITFDTVLRGMLTPTEYRLKKNRLLSTC